MKKALAAFVVSILVAYLVMDQTVWKRTNPIVDRQGKTGVVFRDRLRESSGFNLQDFHAGCKLFHNDGGEVKIFPGSRCEFSKNRGILFNTIYDGYNEYVAAYDLKGRLLWKHPENVHHYTYLDPVKDEFFVLNWRQLPFKGQLGFFAGVAGYDAEGNKIFDWRSEDHLEELFSFLMKDVQSPSAFDYGMQIRTVIKLNSVVILRNHPLAAKDPAFSDGNLLVSVRRGNALAIIDRKTGQIVWHHIVNTGDHVNLGAHTAQVMKNGHFLYAMTHYAVEEGLKKIMANYYSAVVELDPAEHREVWVYKTNPPSLLKMDSAGSVQELENGNILIVAETPFYAFEVTKKKRLVWQYFNTETGDDGTPLPMYRVTRLPEGSVKPFLKE